MAMTNATQLNAEKKAVSCASWVKHKNGNLTAASSQGTIQELVFAVVALSWAAAGLSCSWA